MTVKNPLLDPPAISAPQFNTLAQSIATLFGTRHDVLLPQGEAVLPLEAAARGVAHPGSTALNVITSPYGRAFGRWLREGGTEVVEVEAPKSQPIDPDVVRRALEQHPEISVVSFVHVEAISGVRNDAELISRMAHDHGAIVVLDAVASIGAHDVAIDEWGLDITVLAPQKALAGPAGISIAVINDRAWKVLSDNPRAPRGSILSLLDWKEQWLDTDRSVVPIILAPLEVLALEAAVERLQREGLASVTRRHRAAAAASRAGARALGLTPFVEDDDAAVVVTTLRAPDGSDARSLVRAASVHGAPALSPGFGELSTDVIRIDHTGERARLDVVLASLNALGSALGEETPDQVAIDAALATASQAWTDELDAN
jgi:aspartate aminotransferase-like enzyme